jgi:hypothetical protein
MKGEVAKVLEVEALKSKTTRLDAITRKLFGLFYYLEKNPIPGIDVDRHRSTIKEIAGAKYDNLIKDIETFKEELLLETEVTYSDPRDIEKALKELIINFEDDLIRNEFNEVMKSGITSQERNERLNYLNKKRLDLDNKKKQL